MEASDVKAINESILASLKATDRSDPDALDAFLKDHAVTLPDSHQMTREVQYGQLNLFKSVDPDLMDVNHLLKKSMFCKQLLDLADKIEPGMTKWRGELLFDTQATAVILTQRAINEGRIKNFQAQEIFAENLGYLQESIAILQVEPGEKEKLTGELEKLSQLLEDASEE